MIPRKSTIPETIEIECQDCGKPFRWFPNSTIKPVRCKMCENKKLLSRSTLYDKKPKERHKPIVFATKKANGLKSPKNSFDFAFRKKSNLQKSADAYFSKYIRLKYSFESNGERFCVCYTCGSVHKITNIQLGHWQRRGYYTTRYHEDNGRPQCIKCNYHHSGMPEVFELHLIKDLGQEIVDELKKLSQTEGRDDNSFYNDMSMIFRNKFKNLIKQLQIKNPWK